MTSDVQPDLPESAARLLAVAERVSEPWLRRVTMSAAPSIDEARAARLREATDAMAAASSSRLLDELRELLATDVDAQRTNPLSLFRSAVAPANELLMSFGIAPPRPDDFTARVTPDDPFRLGPATWSDIDAELHEPGLVWGAWKAMTVLQRRREEGLR